jgi:tetratricopeptide (TPR) repeat protein
VIKFDKIEFLHDPTLKVLYQKAKAGKNDVNALFELGCALSMREYSAESVVILEEALKKNPEDGRLWHELIFATASESHMQELAKAVEAAFGNKDSFIKIRNLALINHYLGEFDKAIEYCEKLKNRADIDYTFYEVYAYILFWQNEYDKALQLAGKSLEMNNKSIRSWRLLGHCFFEKGDLVKAEEAYNKAVELDPMYVRGWFSLGQLILNDKNRFIEGHRCLTRTMCINPYYWNSYFTLIDFYLGYKMYLEAIGECRKILNLMPEPRIASEALNYLGILQYNQGDYRQALANFRKSLDLGCDTAVPYYYIGQIHFKIDDFTKALENFEKAIEIDPSFAWAHTQAGFALLEKRKYSEAISSFEEALEQDSEEYWAYMGLADIYRKKKQPKKQLEVMLKAKELAEGDSDVHNRLAIAYECNNLPADAEKAYLRALELDPMNRKAANNLGYMYEKLFNSSGESVYKEKAIEAWKKRLLICRDDGSSMKGSALHLEKLGVRKSLIDKWVEIGEIEEERRE